MEIKVADIAKLRAMTGAGMMDCKKALTEAEGDFAKAQEIIREKGKLVAAKRADRETSEGAVVAQCNADKTQAILVCLGCETDFVANTAEFRTRAGKIAETALNAFPADLEALKGVEMDGLTINDAVLKQTGTTGEKHSLAFYAPLKAAYVGTYVHINHKVGTIVGFNKPVAEDLAKGIAMQITAMNPVAVDADSVPADVVKKEYDIAIEKTKEEQVQRAVDAALKKAGINPAHVDSEDHIESNTAKGWLTPAQAEQARQIIKTVGAEKAANLPAAMIESIAKGRINKFFKEQTLTEQEYQMADEKISVKDYIASQDKEAKVTGFFRFSLADLFHRNSN